jgi:predicted transcriptional regulator
MTIRREGKPDFNINRASAWALFIVSVLAIIAAFWAAVVWAVHQSELPDRMAAVETQLREFGQKQQETSNEIKAMVSVQQSQGVKLDTLAEAMGVPVGRNFYLATNSVLAYKPSKNGNDNQP